jgi:hypothetical protein
MEENEGYQIYTKEDYEKDLIHSDVLICYQKMLTEKIGYPVTLSDAEEVAYGWGGTSESRTEQIRQKYAGPLND